MFSRLRVPVVGLALLLSVSLASAADDPLEAIPESATVVARLKNPTATAEKLVAFANQIDPAWGGMIKASMPGLGVLISNPTMNGVDQKQDWWLAVFATAKQEPGIVFIIPTTDATAMTEALGEGFKSAKYDKWMIYSEDEKAMEQITARLKREGKSIAGLIDKESKGVMDGGELSAFVNVKQLATTYKVELDNAEQEMEEALEGLKTTMAEIQPGGAGMNMAAIFDIYGSMAKGMLQALRDTETFTLSIAAGKKGVGIQEYATVTAGSGFDKFLQRNPPSELKLMNRLPENQLAYYGFHGNIQGMMAWAMKFSVGMMAGGDEEKAKQINDAVAEYAKLVIGSIAGSFALGDLDTGAIRVTALMEMSPTEKVREITRKMMKAFGTIEYEGLGFRQVVEFKADAETIGQHKVDVMNLKQEFQADAGIAQMQSKMMEMIYGPDGMTSRFVYLKDLLVQTQGGGGKSSMVAALKRVEATAKSAENNAISPTRSQLIPKSNLIGLIDLPGLAVGVIKLVAASGQVPIPVDVEALDDLKIERSFTGVSMACEKRALRLKTSVPVEQVKGIYQLVMFFKQQMAQPGF